MIDKANLACGNSFVVGDGWVNLDFAPMSADVTGANLLGRLPFEPESLRLVYSSHFLEHIPRSRVSAFLSECRRILQPDGTLRLVLPDFEEMAREYLLKREAGEHEKADFMVVEIVDQCVRRSPGGELKSEHSRYRQDPIRHAAMVDYVRERTGERLSSAPAAGGQATAGTRLGGSMAAFARRLGRGASSRLRRRWIEVLVSCLPEAFREQNVSMASVGERHHWLWDFHQLRSELERVGFVDVRRMSATTSGYAGFPFGRLDVDEDGCPRKGRESMYVEAKKGVRQPPESSLA
jgi:hypothetical protein